MTPEELKRAFREPAASSIEHELARNREARAKAAEDAARTMDTPSFSATDLAVFARRVSKATAAKEREAAARETEIELARERAYASLEVDDPAAIFAAADELLRATGEVDREFVMEWAYWEPDEAAAWLRQTEEANRQQQGTVSFLRQQGAEEAQRKRTEESLRAADAAYGELEREPDFERVAPYLEGLVREQPENFLTALSQAPEETLQTAFEGARELDRAHRITEFRNAFRDEIANGMDWQLSGEEMPKVEPAPDMERVHQAVAPKSGNVERFKEALLDNPIEAEMERWRLSEVEGS